MERGFLVLQEHRQTGNPSGVLKMRMLAQCVYCEPSSYLGSWVPTAKINR